MVRSKDHEVQAQRSSRLSRVRAEIIATVPLAHENARFDLHHENGVSMKQPNAISDIRKHKNSNSCYNKNPGKQTENQPLEKAQFLSSDHDAC